MNRIWERKVKPQRKKDKPNSTSDRRIREEWIKSKYVTKEFLGIGALEILSPTVKEERVSTNLHKAAKKADVIGIARFIAHGASINWKNEEKDDRTVLEICVDLMKDDVHQATQCVELLLQNGADTNCLDEESMELCESLNITLS